MFELIFAIAALTIIVLFVRKMNAVSKEYTDAERIHKEKCDECEYREIVVGAYINLTEQMEDWEANHDQE